ncbi:hypothetical protein pdam_00007508 [Pocillopora damicornis]|uniref:Uncharacterized protein n=1 Tax=Pocillopora damicornis TaxID=46731 RepID=A0A3M6TGJ0_POCDA|nr:hypothetical protein pdam_00007508 [Pocillopora damicornis]
MKPRIFRTSLLSNSSRVHTKTGRTVTARRKFPIDKFMTNKLGIVRSCLFPHMTKIIKKFPKTAKIRIVVASATSMKT